MGSLPVNLSASRGAAILGVSKYKTPLVAWLEIMEARKPRFCSENGYETPERVDPFKEPLNPKHASLRWGLSMEDAITDLVGNVTDREKLFTHPQHDFLTTHIDGLKTGRLQENKTAFDMAFKMGWGEPGSNMIPEDYQIQVQHQSMCSGIAEIDVNVLVFPKSPAEWERMGYKIHNEFGYIKRPERRVISITEFSENLDDLGYFHKYHIEANKELQKEMLTRYLEFWNENVLGETPPPVNGYDDIKWLIAAPEGEIEATPEMKEMWSEYVDIDNEIESMIERKSEIKNNFALWVQKEIESKNVKEGNEKRKLNIYAGSRKLFSITRAYPGLKVSKSMVDTLKENDPDMYETMKSTSFADIMPEELDLTEKQLEKINCSDEAIEAILNGTILGDDFEKLQEQRTKAIKSIKLTKLLSKDSIMKHLEKTKPELFKLFYEHGIVEMSNPKSTLRISKPEKG